MVLLAKELIQQVPDITWATFRKKRSALASGFRKTQTKANIPAATLVEMSAALELLGKVSSQDALKKSRRTSARKLKKISAEDHTLILAELTRRSCRSKYADACASAATILRLAGLRPVELAEVVVHPLPSGDIDLVVRSAKMTQGRGLASTRKLQLQGLDSEEVANVLAWPSRFSLLCKQNPPDKVVRAISIYYKDAARKVLGPRHEGHSCFYSYRHQLTADMKSAGMTLEEIAAVLGHRNNVTGTRHYGRRVAGNGRTKVTPDPTLVPLVRQTAQPYKAHRNLSANMCP